MTAAHAGTAYIDIEGDFSRIGKQLVAQTGLLSRKGHGLGLAIGGGVAAGVAAGGVGKALFDIGAEFDNAYDHIRIGTGKTGKALKGLEKDFRSVVKTVPATFDNAGQAVAGLSQRLHLTGKPLQRLSEQILELSRITGTDIQQNVPAITRLFGDWSISTDRQAKTLDKLFRVSQVTGIKVGDLSRLMVQFGSPLRQLGLDFDTSAAMFARFEREGVNISTLLPGLRFALKQFAKAGVDPAEGLQKTFEKIRQLGKGADATQIAFKVFGVRAGADMAAAIEEGRFSLDKLIHTMRSGKDTIRGAGQDTQDFAEKWQLFRNELAVKLEPVATKVFDGVRRDAEALFKVIDDPHLTTDQKISVVMDRVGKAISDAMPVIADRVGHAAPKIAEALADGFLNADPIARLVIGGLLLKKLGGLTAFRALGSSAGRAAGTGYAAGFTTTSAAATPAGGAPTPGRRPAIALPASYEVRRRQRIEARRVAAGLPARSTDVPPGRVTRAAQGARGVAGTVVRADPLVGAGRVESRLAQSPAVRAIGQSLAIGVAAAFGPELVKRIQQGLSSATPQGLPQQRHVNVPGFKELGVNPKVGGVEVLKPLEFSIQAPLKAGAAAANAIFDSTSSKADKFSKDVTSSFKSLSAAGNTRGLAELSDKVRRFAATAPEGADAFRKFSRDIDRSISGVAVPALEKMRAAGGHSMSAIRKTVADSMFNIEQNLGSKSAAGKTALSKNFDAAVGAIRKSMAEGKISTKTGLDYIEFLMRQKLSMFGIKGKEATRYLAGQDTKTGKDISTARPGGYAGGMVQIGRAGEAGRDNVPAILNGRAAVVARGEVVSVFNRHQMRGLDSWAQEKGYRGLTGFMASQPKNYMAGGGLVNAAGGLVTGDTDYGPEIAKRLNAMAEATHQAIHVTSGGRTRAEQAALLAKYGANNPSHPVAGLNGPHVQGIAGDISPGREVFGKIAARFGLGFTVPQEPWHIQLIGAIAEGAGAAIAAAVAPKLKHVKWTGPGGALGALGQKGLDRARSAAQEVLARAAATSGTGGDGTDLGAGKGFPQSGSGRALMEQISRDRGWNFGDWWEVDRIETGHGANIVNPTSTARLRGQFLSMNWGRYGPGSDPRQHPSMREQIISMARYIADRYTNPTAAAAHEHAFGWYSRGGLIAEAAGGLLRLAGGGGVPGGSTGNTKLDTLLTIDSGAKKKKKKARHVTPFTGGPALPDVSKVKGRIGHKRAKRPLPKWLKRLGLVNPDELGGLIPDWAAVFDTPRDDLQTRLKNLIDAQDLSVEQPTVTLYDSDQFPDLTNYLQAHPDVLRGMSVDAWIEKNGEDLEVVNYDGLSVQGEPVPGIAQRVAELDAQLATHGAPGQAGTIRGLLETYLSTLRPGQIRLTQAKRESETDLELMRSAWETDQQLLEQNRARLAKLEKGPGSWQQRVADNDAKITVLEGYLRKVREASIGHRLTDAAKHHRDQAQNKLADLRKENTRLKDKKPAPKLGSKEATRQLRAEVAKLHGEDSDLVAVMTAIAGGELTGPWAPGSGSMADDRITRIAKLEDALTDAVGRVRDVSLTQIPAEEHEIAALQGERANWSGTRVTPAHIQRGKTDNALDKQRLELVQQQLREERQRTAVSEALFGALKERIPGLPTFGGGGIIPGPAGAPRLIEAHGNEGVFTPDQMAAMGGGAGVRVIVHGDIVSDRRDPVEVLIGDRRFDAAVERATRRQARTVRGLPGRAGAMT